MGNVLIPPDLELKLPHGWVEHPNPGGPKEYWATRDGTTGILQVSKFGSDDFEFISKQTDLGAFAAALGTRLGTKGQNWGNSAGGKQGTCALGRFGFSMFQGGEYPAMLLWVTMSSDSALMWTWFGPNPVAEEVRQALQIVLETRQRPEGLARP